MVRVWNVPYQTLDDKRLLGQHVESHILFNISTKRIQNIKAGYQNHPQALRFIGCEGQLIDVHMKCVNEMINRGFNHHSPLDNPLKIKHQKFTYTPEMEENDVKTLKERWNQRLHQKAIDDE